MKFDVLGRIRNMGLPDGKTAILYSIYEAVSNSLHSIEDRFGKDRMSDEGWIYVQIDTDDDGDVEKIAVTDNGIGFNEENLDSFETSDSRHKYQRGGKGVGRFVWIKTFDRIGVSSVTKNGNRKEKITFRFMPEKDKSIAYKKVRPAKGEEYETTIELSELKTEQRGQIRIDSYLKDLALHFFPHYISDRLPDITICHNGVEESLFDFINDRADEVTSNTVTIEINGKPEVFRFDHLYVESTMPPKLKNAYLLTAHGRLVGDPISVARKFDLSNLENGKAYTLVVSGDYLDQRVDQERLAFKMPSEAKKLLEKAIMKASGEFLADHLAGVRAKQRRTVEGVLFEHPQLASQIADIDDYVESLSPDMDDEKIAQNLFVLLFRDEQDILDELSELRDLDSLDGEAKSRAEQILAEAENQEKHRLAELVVKRHQVLEIANLLIKFKDGEEGVYEKEEAIHDLILPMREMFRSGETSDHNLWILDDAYAQYEFFASDKPINSFVRGKGSGKEPDAIFFNPLGFRREGSNEPVALVEFKRPGDKQPSSDPVDQVLGYIEKLREHRVVGFDGEPITDINKDTRFECVIVCELTKPTRKKLERSLAQNPTPDGEGYYGWSREHKANIRVISFKKMLRDAELRNRAFFNRLKLGSPSARAKARLARRVLEKEKITVE